jgi:hypothetical protein
MQQQQNLPPEVMQQLGNMLGGQPVW